MKIKTKDDAVAFSIGILGGTIIELLKSLDLHPDTTRECCINYRVNNGVVVFRPEMRWHDGKNMHYVHGQTLSMSDVRAGKAFPFILEDFRTLIQRKITEIRTTANGAPPTP